MDETDASEVFDVPEFSIYPRGFLGDRHGDGVDRKIQRPDPIFRAVQHTFKFPVMPNVKAYSNKGIDRSYAAYLTKVEDWKTMEFREKVYLQALKAFGTMDFAQWYSKQFVSPSVGDMHHRFLDDTLRFIGGGTRDMCMENWRALVTYSDRDDAHALVTPTAAEFFGISTHGRARPAKNRDLITIIQLWTARPGGFEDMLCTLHILFGELD